MVILESSEVHHCRLLMSSSHVWILLCIIFRPQNISVSEDYRPPRFLFCVKQRHNSRDRSFNSSLGCCLMIRWCDDLKHSWVSPLTEPSSRTSGSSKFISSPLRTDVFLLTALSWSDHRARCPVPHPAGLNSFCFRSGYRDTNIWRVSALPFREYQDICRKQPSDKNV